MPVITCPHCRTAVEIDAQHLGAEVQCGRCDRAFIATVEKQGTRDWGEADDRYDDDDDRSRRRRRRRAPEFVPGEGSFGEAQQAVKAPALGLIWTGWIGAFLYVVGGISLVAFGMTALNQAKFPKDEEDAITAIVMGGLIGFFAPIYSILIAFGGHQLLKLKRKGWALAATIMGMASISICHPCNPLVWAGLGFGIWSIVAMQKPVVKWAFERNAPREN